MPIRFRCESCESRIKVPDGSGGRRVRCPRCGYLQRVPNESLEPAEEAPVTANEPPTPDDPAFELADTPPTAPPALAEAPPAPPPATDNVEPVVEETSAAEPSETADEDAAAPAATEIDSSDASAVEDAASDAPAEVDAPWETPPPDHRETLEVDEPQPDEAEADDALLFDQARAETVGVPEHVDENPPPLEEGDAITARDVIGRSGSRDPEAADVPEPPAELLAGAAPRPRSRPKPPPAIPLAGRPSSAMAATQTPDTATGDAAEPEESTAPGPVRLAPRDPSMPPPLPGSSRPSVAPPAPADGRILMLLSNLLRVVAMRLVVAGVVHLVQVLGAGTRIAVLFNAAVVWLAAASVTWTVGEIAAAVHQRRS